MHAADSLPPSDSLNRSSIPQQIWCYYAAFIVLALGAAALGPTLSELAEQTETSLKDVSVLFSMRALGYLLMARVIGKIYDRSKGHGTMSLSLVIMGGLFLLVPLISHLWLLSPVMLLIGIASAFVDLGGNILLLWAAKNDVGPSMNGLHFSFGLGAFISPLLVGLLLTLGDGSGGSGIYIYWVISALSLPVAFWIYKTPSPSHPVVSKKYAPPPPVSAVHWGIIVFFFFLYAGSEQSFGGWIHTYGVQQNGLTEVASANLTSVFWGFIAVGRLLAVPFVMRFKVHTLLRIQVTGTVLVSLLMLLKPDLTVVTWISAGLMGLLMSSIFPLMLSYLEPFVAGSGRITSLFFIGAGMGAMVTPWLIGQYFESIGPGFFPSAVFVYMIIATGGIFFIMHVLGRNK